LRKFFDPGALGEEVSRALEDAFSGSSSRNLGSAGNSFRYVPMMCERTPVSLSLLDALSAIAADLLGRAALPLRAKGTRYFGETAWHRDSGGEVASLGFAAYLEPLREFDGALRVVPGSHRRPREDIPTGGPIGGMSVGEAIETEPGDVIAFDERVLHASAGGSDRRQWRVDFFADPHGEDEEGRVRAWLAGIFQPGWDGGYDIARYPSYGVHWQQSSRWEVGRLRDLGVYALAAEEEEAALARRAIE